MQLFGPARWSEFILSRKMLLLLEVTRATHPMPSGMTGLIRGIKHYMDH
jgi:hypothetical protein